MTHACVQRKQQNTHYFCYFCHMDYFTTDVLASGFGNISVALLSTEGLRALRFHQKYLNLCSEDQRRSYGFGMT